MESLSQTLKSNLQYTVNSESNNSVNNSKQYTVMEVRSFVEQLDKRVYVNPKFLPFYCKAARILGFSRLHELQQMVVTDPRINKPSEFCAERVFWCALRDEMQRKQRGRM